MCNILTSCTAQYMYMLYSSFYANVPMTMTVAKRTQQRHQHFHVLQGYICFGVCPCCHTFLNKCAWVAVMQASMTHEPFPTCSGLNFYLPRHSTVRKSGILQTHR